MATIEMLTRSVADLNIRLTVLEKLHESEKYTPLVDPEVMLAWNNLFYIAKHCSFSLRYENNRWDLRMLNPWNSCWNNYDDLGVMLRAIRSVVEEHERY